VRQAAVAGRRAVIGSLAVSELPVQTSRHRVLYASATLRAIEVRAGAGGGGTFDTKWQPHPGIVLPLEGVFALGPGTRDLQLASAGQVLTLAADVCYRFRGERGLVLDWPGDALAADPPRALTPAGAARMHSSPARLLSPSLVLERARFWRRLRAGALDPLDVEETALMLLRGAIASTPDAAVRDPRARRHARRRVQRVQEAIAVDPAARWTLDRLARIAAVSPGRLAHLFRAETGLSVYAYVVRARLIGTVDRVLDGDEDLARVATDGGFAHHSHYTARFRQLFGITPSELRASTHPPVAPTNNRITTACGARAA
jgi:AraC-like DNA-binding protein